MAHLSTRHVVFEDRITSLTPTSFMEINVVLDDLASFTIYYPDYALLPAVTGSRSQAVYWYYSTFTVTTVLHGHHLRVSPT